MTGNSLPSQPASRVLRVAVAGASGRMGRMLIEALRASDDMVLAGALDVAASPAIARTPRLFWATQVAWPSRQTCARA